MCTLFLPADWDPGGQEAGSVGNGTRLGTAGVLRAHRTLSTKWLKSQRLQFPSTEVDPQPWDLPLCLSFLTCIGYDDSSDPWVTKDLEERRLLCIQLSTGDAQQSLVGAGLAPQGSLLSSIFLLAILQWAGSVRRSTFLS